MVRMLALLGLALATGCVKTSAFRCEGDSARCSGSGARCEVDGFCSVPAATCASGFEYSDTAGELAGTCVGGDQPTPDGPLSDAGSDAPGSGCNPDFAAITDGNAGHKYKLIATPGAWLAQHDTTCVSGNQSYLAIPDDAAELAALRTLAGGADVWVGVNDRVDEGMYREVLGNTIYTALPIATPGGQQTKDCVRTVGATLETDDCDVTRVAVCECNE